MRTSVHGKCVAVSFEVPVSCTGRHGRVVCLPSEGRSNSLKFRVQAKHSLSHTAFRSRKNEATKLAEHQPGLFWWVKPEL